MDDWGVFHDERYLSSRYAVYRRTNQFPNGEPYDSQRRTLKTDFDTLDLRVAYWINYYRKRGKK